MLRVFNNYLISNQTTNLDNFFSVKLLIVLQLITLPRFMDIFSKMLKDKT